MVSQAIGYVCCLIAVVFYGVCFVPVKKINTGDGMIFQWILCNTIGLSGILFQTFLGDGQFYTLSIIGGFIWACGNILTVPIVNLIGLSLGLPIWSMCSMVMGWACSRFGIFFTPGIVPKNLWMSYSGIVIIILGTCIYGTIKLSGQDQTTEKDSKVDNDQNNNSLRQKFNSFDIYHQSEMVKKMLGIFMAAFSGICYGIFFEPANFIQHIYINSPQIGYHYVMGSFLGVFIGGNFFFIVYCILNLNKIKLPTSRIFLPSFASGFIWSAATTAWFFANCSLSNIITFPVISMGPSLVASSIGIIFFGEIRGMCNYIKLAVSALIIGTGIILTTLSK